MTNPTIVGGTQNNAAIAAAQTSATVTSTGSVTSGNLMIVTIEVSGATAPTSLAAPDGTWSTLISTTVAAGVVAAAIFYKKATATGSFSGAFTWTTNSLTGQWAFMEWSGVAPALVDPSGPVSSQNASATNPTTPNITPGFLNDELVAVLFGSAASVSTVAIPAGMTSVLVVNGAGTTPLLGIASLDLATAAAPGAKTWTLGTAEATLGVSFLITGQDSFAGSPMMAVM